MKNILFLGFLIVFLSFVGQVTFGQKADKTGSVPKMGASQIKITPEKPVLMSGYAARTTPFTKVHDDLYASALFFSMEKSQSIIITTDLIGFPSNLIDEIKKMISSRTGVPAQNIMISAVHSHGGPDTRTYEKDTSKAVTEYITGLKEKLTSIAFEASKNAVPFKMGIGKGVCNMNINRRASSADGSIFLGENPDGPVDHDLVVVKFEDLNKNVLAVLINWPCHGTMGGQENYQITGDWPGAAARAIRKQLGDNVVVPVTIGASANIAPLRDRTKNFNEIEALGFHVGSDALKILSQVITFPFQSSVEVRNEEMIFPGKKSGTDYSPTKPFESGPDVPVRLSVFKIGHLVLAGISGELMTEIGMEVKKLSPFSATMIVTHCNGSSGYICTDKAFPEGGYEIRTTRLMPGAEKPLTMKFLDLINSF